MIEVESSVLINQPIDKVFAFVTTPENDAQWYIGLESRDHTPGEPAGVGSTSQSDIRFMGVAMTVTWEVIGYDPPNKIEVKTIEGRVSVEADYLLCRLYDDDNNLAQEAETTPVLKPWELRYTPWHNQTLNGVAYVYSDYANRTADATENQQLTPDYFAGAIIYCVHVSPAEEIEVGLSIRLMDANSGRRGWCDTGV